jgi:hypothetical protein
VKKTTQKLEIQIRKMSTTPLLSSADNKVVVTEQQPDVKNKSCFPENPTPEYRMCFWFSCSLILIVLIWFLLFILGYMSLDFPVVVHGPNGHDLPLYYRNCEFYATVTFRRSEFTQTEELVEKEMVDFVTFAEEHASWAPEYITVKNMLNWEQQIKDIRVQYENEKLRRVINLVKFCGPTY